MRIITIVLALLTFHFGYAQKKNISDEKLDGQGAAKVSDMPSFEETGIRFKNAIAKNDMKVVADMMRFPFSSYDWGYLIDKLGNRIETKEDFLKIAKKIFTKLTVQTIKKEEFKFIEDENGNYYTLVFQRDKTSAAWIVFFLVDGEWKAVSTDNISE